MSDIDCFDPEFSRNLNINEILRDMENKTKEISLNENFIKSNFNKLFLFSCEFDNKLKK